MSDEPEETSYYLRLLSMYMDLGTDIVLDVFVYHTPGQDAETFLMSKQGEIIQLKKNHVLNGQECDLLFQKGNDVLKSPLDIKSFDISLLITLSRHLLTNRQLAPPVKGWKVPPKNIDKSIAADLLRLRKTRNVIIGSYPRARITLWRFEDEWENVSEILLRLQQQIDPSKVRHLRTRIEAYRLQHIEATVKDKYDEKLKGWHHDVAQMQDKVEEMLKKLGDFEAYFNSKSDRFERYTKLLFKGGHFVLSAFLDKKIKDEGKDLCKWLDDNENAIRENISDKEQLDKLYPSISSSELEPKDTSSWNVSLLSNVILHMFSSTEDELVMENIKKIGEAYRNYSNASVLALESNAFEDYWTDLKASIIILSYKIDKSDVKTCYQILDECKKKIEEKEFKTYMEELKAQGSQIKSFTELYQDVLQRSKDHLQDMATHGISLKNAQVLELKMITIGTDEQQKKLAEEILLEVWKEALDRAVQSTDFLDVKKEVSRILEEIKKSKSVENISVREKCILLQIKCTSPREMLNTIDYFQRSQFHETIKNIYRELGYFFDTTFDVYSVITVESLWRIFNQTNQTVNDEEDGLSLQMTVSSPAGMKHLISLCSKDKIKPYIKRIAEALSQELEGSIALEATTDMKKHVFNDTDCWSSDSCSDYASIESDFEDGEFSYQVEDVSAEGTCFIALSDGTTHVVETNQDHIYNNALKNLKLTSSEALEEKGDHIVETEKRMFEVDEGLTKFGKDSNSDGSSTETNIKDNQSLHEIDTSTQGNDNIPEGQQMVEKSVRDKKEPVFGTSTMIDLKKQNIVLEENTKQTEDFVDELLQLVDRRREETEEDVIRMEEDLKNIGIAEKRIKIVDHKVERMKENFQKALQEENHYAESFKDDISLITKQLTDNHRVIVTGYDNTLTYKCALTSVRKRNYQPPDQCLEITNPSDWKRIIADDVQLVLFREPFGRAAYAPQKVEVMLEEFDTMLDATKDENEKIIDIVIVTNQRRLNEVIARTHKHEMLSPVSTIYIDSEAGDTQGEASSAEDTVFSNLLDFSKLYRQNYERKTVYNAVQFEAESLFVETSAVTIVGPARSGKTGLSFDLLPLYDLSNGEENFVVVIDPGELKYIKFSLRPVVILKLLYGTEFDRVEAYKWYRQFNRLHAAVLGKKAAVIIIVEAKTFKKWNENMPAHHLLDHVVEIPEKHATEVKKRENGNANCGSHTEETKYPSEESEDDFKNNHENNYLDLKSGSHDKDKNLQKEMQTENEDSNNARKDSEWYQTVLHPLEQKPASDSDVHTILGKPNETKRDKLGNSQYYSIDTQAWKRCTDMKDKHEADRLVNDRILPDQDLLDRASELFGKSSSIVKHICDSICLFIKDNVNEIVSVYPAIDCGQNSTSQHITFVILTDQPLPLNTIEYRYHTRCIHENTSSHSDENMVIQELEENCQKDLCETKKIREILSKHSKSLMEQHTNITRISISWVKSKGYGTEKNHSMEPKTCIAVNVQSKGFVPLNENVLPKTIDGIDVDIREGVAFSYGFVPNEHHEELKMGCAIHCNLTNEKGELLGGTLGGFVEIEGVLYCISCAHNFFSPADMEKLKNHHGYFDLRIEKRKFEVYQPVLEGSQAFGEVTRAVYKEGGNGATGVDAVLIEIKRRKPISGEFAQCPHHRTAEVKHRTFQSGKMVSPDELNRLINSKKLTVVKFGAKSGWTRGVVRYNEASARLIHMVATNNKFEMLLHNQLEVDSIGNIDFAVEGDSGSLVFTDENDQLSVIGIVEGGLSRSVFITPIFEVFKALGYENVRNMKTFSSMQNESIPSSIDMEVETTSENNPQNPEENVEANVHDIHPWITSHAGELGPDIHTLINQEMSQVKKELKSLKSDVHKTAVKMENAKKVLKKEINQSSTEVKHLVLSQTKKIMNLLKPESQIQNPITKTSDNSLSQTPLPNTSNTDNN